jgi:phosphoribosylglycinamide formyltransferase-1
MASQILVLTYDHPHRKTQDFLNRLKSAGVSNIKVMAQPWVQRKNHVPLYKTRPLSYEIYPEKLCKQLDFDFERYEVRQFKKQNEVIIIAGAGILPPIIYENNVLINAHCGFIPQVRGLDSLKWAIFRSLPIGVTIHRIVDENVDFGLMISRKEVPLFADDSLQTIAMRQYEMEIEMMVDTVINESWNNAVEFDVSDGIINEPTRRMPNAKEKEMIEILKNRLAEL